MKINYNKNIWEGHTVLDFIIDLEYFVNVAVKGDSHIKKITTKQELKNFCIDNQRYYKKFIPEVVNHFAQQYNLK